jgi:iron complex transport system permease protein
VSRLPGAEQTAEERLADRRARMRPGTVRAIGLVAALVALAAAVVLSLAIGSRVIPFDDVVRALGDLLTGRTATGQDAIVITTARVPRTAIAVVAGIGLGLAGALIQAVTRNPLADPGVLGVTYGSGFAIALAVGLLGITSPAGYLGFGLAGALLTTIAVYAIGARGRGSADPARLTLAGVALSAVLLGITTGMSLADPRTFDVLRAWRSGSLQDRGWDDLLPALPVIAAGVVLALALGPALNAVALGDDLATALGANLTIVRALSVVAVTLLAGGATAVAGPIAFVGLMIPHVARWITGPDQRWILVYTLVLSPVLLLAADVVGRVVLRPAELPVGIVTAALGAPVLIALVRRSRASAL